MGAFAFWRVLAEWQWLAVCCVCVELILRTGIQTHITHTFIVVAAGLDTLGTVEGRPPDPEGAAPASGMAREDSFPISPRDSIKSFQEPDKMCSGFRMQVPTVFTDIDLSASSYGKREESWKKES
jgi:hypothetical protein